MDKYPVIYDEHERDVILNALDKCMFLTDDELLSTRRAVYDEQGLTLDAIGECYEVLRDWCPASKLADQLYERLPSDVRREYYEDVTILFENDDYGEHDDWPYGEEQDISECDH